MCNANDVKCVLEVGNAVEDKSDTIRSLLLCQFGILGGGAIASAPWLRLCVMATLNAASQLFSIRLSNANQNQTED